MQNPKLKFHDWRLVVHGIVCGLSFLSVHGLMRVFMPNDLGAVIVFACFATIAASCTSLSIWGALGPDPFWFRMLVIWGIGLLLMGFWSAGFWMFERSHGGNWGRHLRELLRVPLFFLSMTLPLWLSSLFLGWRVVSINSIGETNSASQVSIRDILIVMTTIALALTIAGRAVPPESALAPTVKTEFWTQTGIGVLGCMAVGLLMVIPFALTILRPKKLPIGMMILAGYTLVFISCLVAFVNAFASTPTYWNIVCGAVTTVTCITMTALPLLVYRQQGFRLQWGQRKLSVPGFNPQHLPSYGVNDDIIDG